MQQTECDDKPPEAQGSEKNLFAANGQRHHRQILMLLASGWVGFKRAMSPRKDKSAGDARMKDQCRLRHAPAASIGAGTPGTTLPPPNKDPRSDRMSLSCGMSRWLVAKRLLHVVALSLLSCISTLALYCCRLHPQVYAPGGLHRLAGVPALCHVCV